MIVPPDPRRDAAAAILAESARTWPVVTLRKPHGAFPMGTRFLAVLSSTPGARYLANAVACQCPDYQQRGAVCKHVRAVLLFEQRQHEEGTAPVADPSPEPVAHMTEVERDRAFLAQLIAEQDAHRRALLAVGTRPIDDPVIRERDQHIRRLQAKLPRLTFR